MISIKKVMISRTESIREERAESLAYHLRSLGIKTVKFFVHMCENEHIDEIYMLLKPVLSFANFDWSIAEGDEIGEIYLNISYAEEENGCI